MTALSLEEAIESALERFPNIYCLKDEQKKCIAALLQKKDVLGLLPTGFGKNLIFHTISANLRVGEWQKKLSRYHC